MIFTVSDDCLRLGLRARAVVFRNVRVTAANPALREDIAHEVQAIRARFAGPPEIRALPEVAAFREILRSAGVHARKEQPSVERLLIFALKRGDLPAVNTLVDAYNLVSVRTLCSLGAHDLDKLTPPVALRLMKGRESFTPLGRSDSELVVPGEYGYVDGANRVLCRLDVVQADFSKITEGTTWALLIIEGTAAHPPAAVERAVAEAVERVTHACGGTAEILGETATWQGKAWPG
jgi:DNA/RNA-binding domain of Phe-tRNA-synthetase-like protein